MSTALVPLSSPASRLSQAELESLHPPNSLNALAEVAVRTLPSPQTRRVYRARIAAFLRSGNPLNREGVAAFVGSLRDGGARAGTINQTLAAIRCLVNECQIRKLLTARDNFAIRAIKCEPVRGIRLGNWLTIAGAKKLLSSPDRSTIAGCRDAAVLSLLIGCGLRRAEAAGLTWDNYQEREGRMCLVDIVGKGRRTRTVPVPEWARQDIDRWRQVLQSRTESTMPLESVKTLAPAIGGGVGAITHVLLRLDRLQRPSSPLTQAGVWWIVKSYADKLEIDIRPHDLRRTLAHLMRKAGAPIEQVQFTLGHASVKTTELYLGGRLEIGKGEAGVDRIRMEEA